MDFDVPNTQFELFWLQSGPYDGPPFSFFPHRIFSNPKVFAWTELSVRNAFTAAGSVAQVQPVMQTVDLTDGQGHGVLIATDNIYVCGSASGYQNVQTISFKILYRLKTVSLSEYVGMVQSQQ